MTSINWRSVRRVLVVRLRSIGDTVLATPSLIALRRFLPDAQIDILLEDWVAPVLESFDAVDNVITVGKSGLDRMKAGWKIRQNKYDVVFNLHGGTTSTMLTRATGARYRLGYADYQYSLLYTHRLQPASEFWQREHTHSAEQQLALLGQVGVPVENLPKTRLSVSKEQFEKTSLLLHAHGIDEKRLALIHPGTSFKTKQWSAANFAAVIDHLCSRGLFAVVVTGEGEKELIAEIKSSAETAFRGFSDLSLPEITSLASRSEIFVGNDSGIAHIAAAVGTPTVVIFGSSNRNHWRPWTDAASEIVFRPFDCQPCPGYECAVFGEPRCILTVTRDQVTVAVDRLLN